MNRILLPLISGDEYGTTITYGTDEHLLFDLTISLDGDDHVVTCLINDGDETSSLRRAALEGIASMILAAVAHHLPFTSHSFNHAVIEAVEQLPNHLTDE